MTSIAAIVMVFALIQFVVAIVNLVFSQPFTHTFILPGKLVSILIPARNEEKNIGRLLNGLLKQDYPNIEILVFNDLSTDKTADIVQRFAHENPHIRLIHSEGLPEGWLGKNHACHSLSTCSKGEYLLFLDADVIVGPDLVKKTVAFMQNNKIALLSVFPQQTMFSWGEKATVPLMNFILVTLLPLILVRKSPFPSLAAANGQFMLFDAETYHSLLPHNVMKNNKVEDIEIARYFKQKKIPIACVTGKTEIKCRMYTSFDEAVNGFSKNIFHFFGNSPVMAILFWVFTTLGFVPFLFLEKWPLAGYLTIMLAIRIIFSIASRQSIVQNLIFLIPQQIALGVIIVKAIISNQKKQFEWKGRNIA